MGLIPSSSAFDSYQYQVVFVGLDNAGKTTALYRLKRQRLILASPTVGFNCEKYCANGRGFILWDLCGKEGVRHLWQTYIRHASLVIFVVDASDHSRMDEARTELDHIFHITSQDVPIILLFNKQDLPTAQPAHKVFNFSDRLRV
jgi:small GTP-binding protein